jgi:polyisoprenoid-binding protein YceI
MKLMLIVAAAALAVGAQTYQIDPAHSSAGFSVKHMMVTNVSGKFSNVKGTIVYNEKNLGASSVTASVDVGTVNTNEAKRDEHLRSPDFFDAAKFPRMEFKSTKVYKSGGVVKVDGNLTLHGVTKQVTLTLTETSPEVKHPAGGFVRGAVATTKINRKDFGLTWNKTIESGGLIVGEEVTITLEIEAGRKAS